MSQPPYVPGPSAQDPLQGQVLAAYAAGKPVQAIADWFGIPAERVQQIVAPQPGVPQVLPARKRRLWPFAVAAGVVLLVGVTVAVLVLGQGSATQPGAASAWDLEQQGKGKLQSAKDNGLDLIIHAA